MEERKQKSRIPLMVFALLLLALAYALFHILSNKSYLDTAVVYESEQACEELGKCDCVREDCENPGFGKLFLDCSSGWRCRD